jgi:hypothetical protein
MWDERDGFFYDLLLFPDGRADRLEVRPLVGLVPLCATTVLSARGFRQFPRLAERIRLFLKRHPEVNATIAPIETSSVNGRKLLARLIQLFGHLKPEGLQSDENLGPVTSYYEDAE